ncbi:MAG: hypothetical protein ABS951_12165 [Solibacillus sp.]
MKSRFATWLGVGGAVIGIYLFAQAFWVYYTTRFGDAWKVLLQLI